MFHLARSRRTLALAVFAAVASLWLPQAAAQGQPAPHAVRLAAGGGPAGLSLDWAPWLRPVLRTVKLHRGITGARITIGNFSACPKLPKGFDRSQFSCFLTHITGGQLVIGHTNQVINRNITIAYAEGTDPHGNTAMIFGSLKARPMPVAGGIFLTPAVNSEVQKDRNLQLGVQPVGLGVKPDLTGAGAGFISMKIRAVNTVFGASCFVGARRAPVTVDPTFGTTDPPPPNQPISGHVDSAQFNGTETIIIGTVVDNAFAGPRAHGCGPASALNQVVNEVGGLPSPAGTNTAIFQVTIELVGYPKISS